MQLPIESVITSPAPGFSLPLSSVTPDARYTIRGYASAGSGHRISRVELCLRSPNSPEKWRYCTRSFLPGAGRWGGERHWTWCWWELEVSLVELVDAEEIAVRAQDERHDSQPEHSVWNLKGFLGNGIYRVRKRIEAIDDNETGEKKEAVVSFSHPTDTGEPKNGWMVAKEEEKVAGPELGDLKEVDWDEVGKHNKREDMWIVIDGVVCGLAKAGRPSSSIHSLDPLYLTHRRRDRLRLASSWRSRAPPRKRGSRRLHRVREHPRRTCKEYGNYVCRRTCLVGLAGAEADEERRTPRGEIACDPSDSVDCCFARCEGDYYPRYATVYV